MIFPGGEVDVKDFRTDNRTTVTTIGRAIDRVAADLTALDDDSCVALATDIDELRLASLVLELLTAGVEITWSLADPTAARLMTVRAPGLKALSFAALENETRAQMLKRLSGVLASWAGVE